MYDHTGVMGFTYQGQTYFYQKDLQGNIVTIVNAAGAPMVQYYYDAWGNHKVYDGDYITEMTSPTFIGNLNPFRYRGYYYDSETGLYYLKSRYYDPEVGRFISADAVDYVEYSQFNGLNIYAYCNNNPVTHVDPKGTSWSSFWNAVGNWFKSNIGYYFDSSINIISKVEENWFYGEEYGVRKDIPTQKDNKMICLYTTNGTRIYDFWKVQVGLRCRFGNSWVSTSIGLGEINFAFEYEGETNELQIGIEKIMSGCTYVVDGETRYYQTYFKTTHLALVAVGVVASIYIIAHAPAALIGFLPWLQNIIRAPA